MRYTKTCPKCGSNDIFMIEGYAGGYHMGNNIPYGMTIFSAVPVDRYVCGMCGFSEEWIRREDIPRLRTSDHARELLDKKK